jgi:hypothetical protein
MNRTALSTARRVIAGTTPRPRTGRSAIVLAATLVLSFGSALAQGGIPGIEEVPLAAPFTCVEVGPADVVYGWYAHSLWQSADRGTTWDRVIQFGDTTGCRGVFVARSGAVFLGPSHCGELWRGQPGDPWVWTQPLRFRCCNCDNPADNSRIWKMDEDSSGRLYVGEYGGAWSDTCAYVYRSTDDGDTWTEVYSCNCRHVHFVSVDPYTDIVYAAMGDGAGRQRLVRSVDAGETWEVIRSQDCWAQPISLSFAPRVRIFGSDCGGTANSIYCTADDEVFEAQLLLTGESDAYVWDMSQNADGCTYAGTMGKLPAGSRIALYCSCGAGPTWLPVKEFGVLPEWCGVKDLSRFDSEGWAYCAYSTAPGSVAAFRFRQETADVGDGSVGATATDIGIEIVPNPTRGRSSIWVTTRVPCDQLSIRILGPSGASVRTLHCSSDSGAEHRLDWDGRSDSGDPVGSGVYFVEVEADEHRAAAKLLILK